MLKKLAALLKAGIPVPQAWDSQAKEISFRLWCAAISFHVAVISIIVLHFKPVEKATWTAIGFFGLCMVFYTIKKLTKAKIDLTDGEVELSDDSQEEKK